MGTMKEMNETRETKQAKPRRRSSANDSAPLASGSAAYEAIASRAYELFQARGRLHGYDLDDWLEAERQFGATANPTTRRSGRAPRGVSSGS
jgi:hypothetical protein